MDKIDYVETPRLHQPRLIAGFEGWPNAGEVSSYIIQYLVDRFKAKEFASIPGERFYQFTLLRPIATIKEGRLLQLKFPTNRFYCSRDKGLGDLILFQGTEPHCQWSRFVGLLLDVAEKFDVRHIFTVGGAYDYVPHTYPPVVSALYNHEDLKEALIRSGLTLTEYSGPSSIHTYILEGARKRGIRGTSLWGHAPQYLQAKNLKVIYYVLSRLVDLMGIEMDLSDLERASEYFDQQVNHLVEQDRKLQEIITKLETAYQETSGLSPNARKDDETKDDKVVYIRAFLKKQEEEEKKKGF